MTETAKPMTNPVLATAVFDLRGDHPVDELFDDLDECVEWSRDLYNGSQEVLYVRLNFICEQCGDNHEIFVLTREKFLAFAITATELNLRVESNRYIII